MADAGRKRIEAPQSNRSIYNQNNFNGSRYTYRQRRRYENTYRNQNSGYQGFPISSTSSYSRRPKKTIDRTKTCPMLVKVYCSVGKSNKSGDYGVDRNPSNELHIYTWEDATLGELTRLVTAALTECNTPGTYFDFSVVFPNLRTREFEMRSIGSTCIGDVQVWDSLSLSEVRFHPGDYIDITINPPRSPKNIIL